MIIEAEPRQGDGPLEGYLPSRSIPGTESKRPDKQTPKSWVQKAYSKKPKTTKGRGRKSRSFTEGRPTVDRLTREPAAGSISKCRAKSFHREHPYERDEGTRTGKSRWQQILSTLPRRKCPSLLQASARQKSLSLSDFFQQYTSRKETSSTSTTPSPVFTANVNENNDNCPSAACRYGGLGVRRVAESPSPDSSDQLCDVEIEDLTTAAYPPPDLSDFFSKQDNSWRQRRKSFNTNPLSSSEARDTIDNPPTLLSLGEILSSDSTGQFPVQEQQPKKPQFLSDKDKLNSYQVLGFRQNRKQLESWPSLRDQLVSISQPTISPRDWEETLQKTDSQNGIDDAGYLTSSIEKLVEFFEANTSNRTDSTQGAVGPDLNSAQHSLTTTAQSAVQVTRKSNPDQVTYPSHQGSKGLRQLDRPSTPPSTSACKQSSPIDFSSLFQRRGPDPVIRNSQDLSRASPRKHQQTGVNFTAAGVYNNNANAASASCESRLGWAENHYRNDPFPQASCRKNPPKSSIPTISSSSRFLPSNRGRSTSSLSPLSRVSADVELIDLESTRLSSWPGTHSIPAAFERQRYRPSDCRSANHHYTEKLIDLQTTSKRTQGHTNEWFTNRDFSFATKERQLSQGLSNFRQQNFQAVKENAREGRRENCYQNCFRPIRSHATKVNVVNRASANNHHNEPTICEQETTPISDIGQLANLCSDSREKQFPFGNFAFHHSLLSPLLRRKPNFAQSDPCEMGCIQSIAKAKVSPDRCHHGVIVEDIHAAIDRIPTEIEEKSPIVLRYRTPYFRASAHVIVPPITRKETWTVGWIQACDSMKFINQYGDLGNSSWEIPALKDQRVAAVSDSDGVSYPWYGNTTEIATVEGPTDTSRSLTLRMNDNFYPSVTWDIPVSEGSEAHLTHIVRDQSFTTWLAAVNQTTGRLEVLRTVKWHFYLEIDVDPTKELGKRACIVSPVVQKQPVILKNNTEPIYISSPNRSTPNGPAGNGGRQKRVNRRPGAGGDNNSNNHTNFIPKSALVRPSANNAQTLIWRPTGDIPVIVVPAKEEYKENNEVVWFTRTPTMHGHDHNVRILSLQEMAKLKRNMSRQ